MPGVLAFQMVGVKGRSKGASPEARDSFSGFVKSILSDFLSQGIVQPATLLS